MAPKFNPAEDLSDLTGKVVLVSGVTSGLGYPVALELLRKGATVYIAARNESKAMATIARLEKEGLEPGNGKPVWLKFDLDNPHDIKKSAEEFLSKESRLDILINNAACVGKEYAMGPIDGVQDIVIINHFSPFLFTNLVLPLMKKTAQSPDADVRIVNVASEAHRVNPKVQFKEKSDLNGPTTGNSYWSQLRRYAFTKLLNILWTKELARKLAVSTEDGGADILCVVVHPGAVATEGAFAASSKARWPFPAILRFIYRTFFRPPAEGAATVLVAAASPDLRRDKEKYHGSYLVPIGKLSSPNKNGSNEKLAKDLWTLTEKILADEGL